MMMILTYRIALEMNDPKKMELDKQERSTQGEETSMLLVYPLSPAFYTEIVFSTPAISFNMPYISIHRHLLRHRRHHLSPSLMLHPCYNCVCM